MSRLKRQRLTTEGDDKVTLSSNDVLEAKNAREEETRTSEGKDEQRRSLFVHSLPASTTTETLTALFSQSYPLKHATVVSDPATKQSKGFGFVTFTDVEDAQSAQEAFNGSFVDGKRIKVELAKRRTRQSSAPDGQDAPDASVTPHHTNKQLHQKPPRLIVRNLPWTIKDSDQLAILFRSFGKVKHASMPKRGPGLSAGFGFVLLRGRKNAEKAMEALNGKEVEGRAIAVDWAVDKDKWDNLHSGAQVVENEKDLHNDGRDGENDQGLNSPYGDDNARGAVLQSDVEDSAHPEDQFPDEELMEKDGDEDEDEDEDEHYDEHYNDSEEDEVVEEQHADANPLTLFVRNLPFTATDESLVDHFRHFGGVRYARIVMDPATERSKGVGFVCFYNEQDAHACLKSAPQVQSSSNRQQKNPGAIINRHSMLEDTSIDRSGNFTLDGRVLQITRAVDRKEATRLAFANNSLRETRDKDKRRLYLLGEGNVPSDSPLYEQLSPAEVKMREDSTKQRQSLIKTNPSLHLSLTRLSVRNLPRSIDSKALKSLAREAVVGFAKDVKAGLRKQLTKEESSRGGVDMREAEQARKGKGKGIVTQAKVVFEGREGTKVAESSGAGRSRGYGFVEYSSHRWALMGLRWLNAHVVEPSKDSSLGPSRERRKRLIVEFAIENAQVVMRRRENEAKARETSRIVQEKREAGELPEKRKDWSQGQLMAKTRKGMKKEQTRPGGHPAAANKIEAKVETEASKQAKRQQIIGRKRMLRRNKTKGRG